MASAWEAMGIDERIATYQERYASFRTEQRILVAHVEMQDDPRNIHRVKVRVPGLHDPDPEVTPTEALPWATPGGPLSGQLVSPDVGDVVLVVPIAGSLDHLFIIQVLYANRKEERLRGRQPYKANPKPINREQRFGTRGTPTLPESQNDYSYNDPTGNSAPVETFELRQTTAHTVSSWMRTPRGHAMYTDDEIGRERMRLLDRTGGGIEAKGAVTSEANRGNAYRRGSGSAFNGEPLPMTDEDEDGNTVQVADGEWRILMADALQQFFGLFASAFGESEVRIQARRPSPLKPNVDWEQVHPTSNNTHYISLSEGPKHLKLHSEQGSTITMTDEIELEAEKGSSIVMSASIDAEGDTITLNSGGGGDDGIVRKSDLQAAVDNLIGQIGTPDSNGDTIPTTPYEAMSSGSVFAGI